MGWGEVPVPTVPYEPPPPVEDRRARITEARIVDEDPFEEGLWCPTCQAETAGGQTYVVLLGGYFTATMRVEGCPCGWLWHRMGKGD